jgi:hypothetical protein
MIDKMTSIRLNKDRVWERITHTLIKLYAKDVTNHTVNYDKNLATPISIDLDGGMYTCVGQTIAIDNVKYNIKEIIKCIETNVHYDGYGKEYDLEVFFHVGEIM